MRLFFAGLLTTGEVSEGVFCSDSLVPGFFAKSRPHGGVNQGLLPAGGLFLVSEGGLYSSKIPPRPLLCSASGVDLGFSFSVAASLSLDSMRATVEVRFCLFETTTWIKCFHRSCTETLGMG